MKIEITQATIVTGTDGPDRVLLTVPIKDASWPYTGPLYLSFNAAAGSGAEYCNEHFSGLQVSVVNVGTVKATENES